MKVLNESTGSLEERVKKSLKQVEQEIFEAKMRQRTARIRVRRLYA